ncbi:hydrolase or acyltransferase (alpha beta hydrolase superfamily) [Seiridium cupressi]
MIKAHDVAAVVGDPTNPAPLVVCFHGSGDSCESWVPLAEALSHKYRVLLYNRGETNPKPDSAVHDMLHYLEQHRLAPPYVLIAHSYGGTFAREFLQQRPHQVAGMVLAETGQETALDPKTEQQQYKKKILGDSPLSVIRANILIRKWKQYEEDVAAASSDAEGASLALRKQVLDATDKEDERLKKAQLALSRNHRYIHVPDCGHDVIEDRPEVVAAEVEWVMENLHATARPVGALQKASAFFSSLRLTASIIHMHSS